MELVGAHEVLGLLGDLAVARSGQELRRDRRVEHVIEHGGERVIALQASLVRDVSNEVAHERLGHAGVHAVHAHVIGVVGGPAEGELREVARANHEATLLVRDVHEDLGAFAGLRVLVGHGVVRLVMADIREVLANRRGDAHLTQLAAERLGHDAGVVMRAIRGAEARHRDGEDTGTIEAE